MGYSLPNAGGRPLSEKICAHLLREMRQGDFAQSAALPPEPELARRYGVSRVVIRDALSILEQEGFLRRGRGVGTVIHRQVVNLRARIDIKVEYNELIRAMGERPTADHIELSTGPAGARLAEQLSIDPGEEILLCRKRLLAGDRPVIYSIDRLPLRIFQDVPYASLDWHQPLFDLLETHLGFAVDTDLASLSPTMGPPEVRRLLALGEDEALLHIDEVGYYRLLQPIFHSSGYYTDFFDFTLLRRHFI